MRKITEEAMDPFLNCNVFKKSNTEVCIQYNLGEWISILKLFGNTIAELNHDTRMLKITTAGYNTRTTRERLNGLPGVSVVSKQGQMYLNGEEWDGSWQTIQL
jgi:hypothetical protein